MAINLAKLEKRIYALERKNPGALAAQNVYIQFLGTNYTATQLQNWITKCLTYLESGKTFSEEQIQNFIDTRYASLSAEHQLIADKILAGQFADIPNGTQGEVLMELALIKSILD